LKGKENIEELFKEGLKDFQSPVEPSVWQGVQSGLNAAAGASGSAAVGSAAGKISIVTKSIIGVVSAAALSTGVYYITTDNSSPEEKNTKELVFEEKDTSLDNIVEEDKIPLNSEIEKTEIPEEKKHTSSNSLEEKEKPIETKDDKLNDISNSEIHIPKPKETVKQENTSSTANNTGGSSTATGTSGNSSQSEEENESKEDNNTPSFTISIVKQKNQYVELKLEGDTPDFIEWDMGDGYAVEGEQIEYYYDEPGDYIVRVSAGSVTEEISLAVYIEGEFTNLPNSFTPNNDGVNDYLFVESEGIKEFSIVVFDKKQRVVFRSEDKDFRWNGINERTQMLCEKGDYYYIITAADAQGNTINKHQTISIKY
jgi:gliding motility-associated-like protein